MLSEEIETVEIELAIDTRCISDKSIIKVLLSEGVLPTTTLIKKLRVMRIDSF